MNYYEHHIRDYDAATSHLSWDEDLAYTRLLRWYYRKEQAIPADVKEACRQVRATTKVQRDAVASVLNEFFELREDGWHQNTCDRVIAEFQSGEPERELKKVNEDNRLKRHREERARLFKIITDAGLHAPWNIGMSELRTLANEASGAKPETAEPPLPETAPATPATATQTPSTSTQYPVVNTIGSNDGSGTSSRAHEIDGVLTAAGISTSLIGWERERGKAARNMTPSQQQVIDLAAMRVSPAELRAAYELAVADRDATGDVSAINAGFVRSMVDKVRRPKPAPREDNAWKRTPAGIERKASELGVLCPPGRDHGWLLEKCESVLRQRAQGVAA
ncbi:YdaU family protein [Paraburkholderia bengalensis]|uniref:YdaU family protein n=1 Tax=Paraburkholderia bengalensis TaxID=2747562 RepID=A0ABU8IMU2_9BURK